MDIPLSVISTTSFTIILLLILHFKRCTLLYEQKLEQNTYAFSDMYECACLYVMFFIYFLGQCWVNIHFYSLSLLLFPIIVGRKTNTQWIVISTIRPCATILGNEMGVVKSAWNWIFVLEFFSGGTQTKTKQWDGGKSNSTVTTQLES